MEEIILLTKYISAWGWHLIAVILLATALVAGMLSQIVYIIGLGFGIAFAEFMALNKQRQIYNEAD